MKDYNCEICGKNAKMGTPAKTKDGKIICENCAKGSTEIIQGIDQNTLEPVNEWFKNHIVIWKNKHHEGELYAWYNDGGTVFPLKDNEENLSIPELFEVIENTLEKGNVRCTRCKKEVPKTETTYKLFAGIECNECTQITKLEIEAERKNGHVCLLCGKPYSLCYC